jgi:hypothetical protein
VYRKVHNREILHDIGEEELIRGLVFLDEKI